MKNRQNEHKYAQLTTTKCACTYIIYIGCAFADLHRGSKNPHSNKIALCQFIQFLSPDECVGIDCTVAFLALENILFSIVNEIRQILGAQLFFEG